MLTYTLAETDAYSDIFRLFVRVFSSSEGEPAGQSVGDLVRRLLSQTPPEELFVFVAYRDQLLVGSIVFSRFTLPNEESAFLLSPVAIATELQGKGIGQALITTGLNYLRSQAVKWVFTYGDPAFYSKAGFMQVDEQDIEPPFRLSQPEGWLVQTLDGSPIDAMAGKTVCVEAFNDPEHW
jgi:putative acetyltransferase